MSIIVNFDVFWMLFMSFICVPCTSGIGKEGEDPTERSTLADDSKQIFDKQPAKGEDSDFAPFMKKMFSGLPGVSSIKEAKKGPNVGYRPYWYAYNFALGPMGPENDTSPHQSSHEEWDYGLGRGAGQGLWGGGALGIVHAGGAALGAGDLVNKDISAGDDAPSAAPEKVCYPNMGKTCELGPPPENYDDEYIEAMRKRTIACDTCSDKSKPVGLVCAADKTGTVFQDMDLCVMDKMNCLGGTAYIQSSKQATFSTYPFLMQPQWARVSIRGEADAELRMYDKYPYYSGKTSYRLVVYGWPYSGPYSAIYRDYSKKYDWGKWFGYAINIYNYTEYTITWNPENGWFLMSQARLKDWQSKFYIEYVDPKPRDMKYIDVSSGWAERRLDFILHDLTLLHAGRCEYQAPSNDSFPSDSEGVRKGFRDVEAGYQRRYSTLLYKSVRPQDWDAEDGSYIEY